jgi:sporulation protein YlmC with PRC-barrel domain
MLMTTVAVIALAAPVAAQDKANPDDATQQMGQQAEQAQQKLEEGAAQSGQTEQGQAADPQAAQGEAEQPAEEEAPAMAEEPAEEEAPAMAEEPAEEEAPAMAEEPAEEEAPAMAEEPAEPADQQTAEEATPPAEMKFIEVQEAEQFLADDEVIGKNVVNPNDEELGTIADLVMDQEQKLVGVVLSVGGFLGIGEKWVAVPVEQIDFPGDDQPARLQVAVTKEQLENAPDFVTKETAQAQQEADQAQQQMQQATPPAPTTAQ